MKVHELNCRFSLTNTSHLSNKDIDWLNDKGRSLLKQKSARAMALYSKGQNKSIVGWLFYSFGLLNVLDEKPMSTIVIRNITAVGNDSESIQILATLILHLTTQAITTLPPSFTPKLVVVVDKRHTNQQLLQTLGFNKFLDKQARTIHIMPILSILSSINAAAIYAQHSNDWSI